MSKTFRSNMRKDVRSLQDAHVTVLGDREVVRMKRIQMARSGGECQQ
jgi:hypothetical protein